MNKRIISLGLAMGLIAVAGCDKSDGSKTANQGTEAVKKAGDKTIGAGIGQDSQFAALAKAAGLDVTLNGPGPYTVFVPDDAAFGKLPAGTVDTLKKPEGKTDLTRTLTYHILPGTVLAEDISKAIDNGKGKAELATMGGEVLTAAKDGDKIVLTDAAGGKSTITQADQTMSNGVVHTVDAVLMPGKSS
jgi:uncharacterized surface protein with fasciclin (FAS1) repeats